MFIVVTLTDGRTWKQPLTQDVQVLGRDPSCEIVLDDPSASRRHALLRFENGRYRLEDLGSKNGTLVNEVRVQTQELKDQDEVLIGSVALRFLEVGDDDTTQETSSVVVSDAERVPSTASFTSRSSSLQLTTQRLQMLYDFGERLTSLRDRDELLDDALSICFETLRFERGAIAVRKPDGRGVDWPVVRNLHGAGGDLTISRTLLGRALDHGERAIITDGLQEPIDPTVSMVQHGIRSAMCVPLMQGDNVLGVIYGDRTSTSTLYTSEDIDFLAGIARQVTIGLVNARLMDEQKVMLAMEAELDVAREIQRKLFPHELPADDRIVMAALNEPGRTVSGDYYDVIEFDDGRIAFLIADVSGKGVAAALLMSNLQAAVRLTLASTGDPADAMRRWNALLYANTDSSKFVTCVACVIDTRARALTFTLAGHQAPYVLRGSDQPPEELGMDPELPLGVVEHVEYQSKTVDLGDGPCTIFCYSDGVVEAMNSAHELFGDERMRLALAESADAPPNLLLRKMRKALSGFTRDAEQSDDITMLAAKLI